MTIPDEFHCGSLEARSLFHSLFQHGTQTSNSPSMLWCVCLYHCQWLIARITCSSFLSCLQIFGTVWERRIIYGFVSKSYGGQNTCMVILLLSSLPLLQLLTNDWPVQTWMTRWLTGPNPSQINPTSSEPLSVSLQLKHTVLTADSTCPLLIQNKEQPDCTRRPYTQH